MERMKYALPIIVVLSIFGVIAFLILVNANSNIFFISIILGLIGFLIGIIGISTVLIIRYFKRKKK